MLATLIISLFCSGSFAKEKQGAHAEGSNWVDANYIKHLNDKAVRDEARRIADLQHLADSYTQLGLADQRLSSRTPGVPNNPQDLSAGVDELLSNLDRSSFTDRSVTSLKLKRPVIPDVPVAFHSLNVAEAPCKVRLYVNELGKVVDAEPVDCNQVLVEAAIEAAMKLVFYPPKDENGESRKVNVIITYVFKVK